MPRSRMSCADDPQKNKSIRTVVNKLNSIHTQFRFFQMELLAGEPDYVVEHVSNTRQCVMKFSSSL